MTYYDILFSFFLYNYFELIGIFLCMVFWAGAQKLHMRQQSRESS